MPRPKKKEEYNADLIMMEILKAVSDEYEREKTIDGAASVSCIAAEFSISRLKARKLLITAGVYTSDACRRVNELYAAGKSVPEIQSIMHISRSSIHSYLPYSKIIYNAKELSLNAERMRLYRSRQAAVKKLQEAVDGEICIKQLQVLLWDAIALFEQYLFQMDSGVKFKYYICDDKILISGEKLCISRFVMGRALKKVIDMRKRKMPEQEEPLDLGCDYIYPVFQRFGLLKRG